MPTYTVKKGDTLWGIVSRDLERRTGKKPSNAAIARAVKAAKVPGSGDKNKIKPGDKISLSYTAGGGSEPRGAEKSNRKQTTRERMRDIERAPKKKPRVPARAAAAERYSGSSSSRPAAKKATKKATKKTTGAFARLGERQQGRLDARKKRQDDAYKKFYPGMASARSSKKATPKKTSGRKRYPGS